MDLNFLYLSFYIKILNKIIYRFLILVNIFPRTEFYFESRYKIIQEYKNNKFRKLIGQFPSLKFLLNFNNIYKINSSAHENFIKIRKRMKIQIILFLLIVITDIKILLKEKI